MLYTLSYVMFTVDDGLLKISVIEISIVISFI